LADVVGEEAMTLTAGSRLGPYEIVSTLDAGGMGEVYGGKTVSVTAGKYQ
jgi:hypothetical protein